jgi:hypothetical protein
MSIAMPMTFLHVPELIDQLPPTTVGKDDAYKKENRLDRLSRLHREAEGGGGGGDHHATTVLDLPLKSIFQRMLATLSGIWTDVSNLEASEYNLRRIIHIFTDGDRLVYLGLFIILFALLMFVSNA